MHRRSEDRPAGQHVLFVPPYVVFYAMEGDQLTVLTVTDARRLRRPW
jgi:hypothetical protein